MYDNKLNRSTLIIYEEFRLLDKQKIESIVSPMKHPRQAEYLKNPKYSNLVEEAREIYITSSGKESEEWYSTIKKIQRQAISGKSAMCIYMDYLIGIKYNMQTVEQIKDERQKMGEETFAIEYENKLIRDNKDGFFSREMVEDCRVLKIAHYPQHPSRYDSKQNILAVPKKDGELILITVDIALKWGKDNDNTIIEVDRLIPTKKGYMHNPIYIEPMNGKNSLAVALRIKQTWYDFKANYIVLDTNGNGIGVYDIMTEITADNTRGIEYPAMTSMYHPTISKYEDYKQRTRAIDALPIIYPMWATESINSEMAFILRDLMRSDMIRFMCEPNDGQEFLMENAKYFDVKKDMDFLSWFMRPYYQTNELQGELVALTPLYSGDKVKLIEPKNGRKDRYSALGYDCWVTKNVLDPKIVKEKKEVKLENLAIVSVPSNNTSNTTANKYFVSRVSNQSNRKLFGR